MKTSTKSTFIILGTLVIGIIIGILAGGILHQKRFEQFERMRKMNPEKRFEKAINEIVRPDEQQRNLIKDILKKQAEKIARLDEEYHAKILSIFDSTRQEINSSLSEEQINRLEERIKRGRAHFVKGHLDRLSQLLDLTEEQKTKIEEILKEFEPPFNQNQESSLGKSDRKRSNIRGNLEKMDKKIELILSPEQRKKYLQFRERRLKDRKGPHPGEFPPPPDNEPFQREVE